MDELGVRLDETQDEFLVRGAKEEKTDVVTAVNHGLYFFPIFVDIFLISLQASTSSSSEKPATPSRG